MKTSLSEDAEPAIFNTTHYFSTTVDASFFGLGAILFQSSTDNKMQVLSVVTRVENSLVKLSTKVNKFLISI